MSSSITHKRRLDRNYAGSVWVIPCAGHSWATVQLDDGSGTWATSAVTVKRSNDGVNFVALSTPVSFTTTPGMSPAIDVRGIGFLCVETTTAEGSAATTNATVCLMTEEP